MGFLYLSSSNIFTEKFLLLSFVFAFYSTTTEDEEFNDPLLLENLHKHVSWFSITNFDNICKKKKKNSLFKRK